MREQRIDQSEGRVGIHVVECKYLFDAELIEQRRNDVRAGRHRLEMSRLVRSLAPRPALAEDLIVIVPSAELLFFPNKLVANAELAAGRARRELFSRVRECLRDVVGQIFEIEQRAFVERFGKGRLPCDAHQQFDVAQRSDKRQLVFGGKRPVDPIRNAVERNADLLARRSGDDAGRRRGKRNQRCGNDGSGLFAARNGTETIGDGKRAAITAQCEDCGRAGVVYEPATVSALRYSWRLRGGPALLARASASALAVSKLVKHTMLASTAARRIL